MLSWFNTKLCPYLWGNAWQLEKENSILKGCEGAFTVLHFESKQFKHEWIKRGLHSISIISHVLQIEGPALRTIANLAESEDLAKNLIKCGVTPKSMAIVITYHQVSALEFTLFIKSQTNCQRWSIISSQIWRLCMSLAYKWTLVKCNIYLCCLN